MASQTEKKINAFDTSTDLHNHGVNRVQEHGSKIFLIFLTLWNVWIFGDLKKAKRELFSPDERYIGVQEVLFFTLGCIFSEGLVVVLRYIIDKRLEKMIDMSKTNMGEAFRARKERVINYLYGSLYHALFFVAMFFSMRGTLFMPKALGGTSDLEVQYKSYPVDAPDVLKAFLMFAMGHSTKKLIKATIYERERKDFMQNVMHHYITSSLIGYSFVTKHFLSGLPILLLHSSTDSISYITRLFKELKHFRGTALYIAYTFFLGSWTYARIISYHVDVYYPLFFALIRLSKEYFYISLYLLFCCTALSFLNVLWFMQIVRSLVVYLRKRR